jgi:hypothetical protein
MIVTLHSLEVSGKHGVPAAPTSGKHSGTHRIAGWGSPRASTDVLHKQHLLGLPGLDPRTLQPVAQSLHQLRYSVSFAMVRTCMR